MFGLPTAHKGALIYGSSRRRLCRAIHQRGPRAFGSRGRNSPSLPLNQQPGCTRGGARKNITLCYITHSIFPQPPGTSDRFIRFMLYKV